MKLLFQGGDELVELHIDREKKELLGRSSKTNYQIQKLDYSELFKTHRLSPHSISEEAASKLNNNDFKRLIVASFAHQGYTLKND